MTPPIRTQTIETRTHGRYLVQEASSPAASSLLIGFHGYKESAEIQMARLAAIPGADQWTLVSIQGLHRFYLGRSENVVASWMTRQDRELVMADNVAYIDAVVDEVARTRSAIGALVFAGFSQGTAMAFRAGCRSQRAVTGILAVGGDVPPELDREALARVTRALVARGSADAWYTDAKHSADVVKLTDAGVDVDARVLNAGHEWTDEFSGLAGDALKRWA